jgi:DNA-directed RNA polymerase sigma subunit (sigma70/sigma32)
VKTESRAQGPALRRSSSTTIKKNSTEPAQDSGRLLTREEERDLAQRIEAGDEDGRRARDRFVEANQGLVAWVAKKRFQTSGVALEDLIQWGNTGLLHAVDKFDWRKGFKFSTHATRWIERDIQRGINNDRLIHLPDNVIPEVNELRAALAEFEERGREPSIDELAAKTGLAPERVRLLLPHCDHPDSLDRVVVGANGTRTTVGEILDEDGRWGDRWLLRSRDHRPHRVPEGGPTRRCWYCDEPGDSLAMCISREGFLHADCKDQTRYGVLRSAAPAPYEAVSR